MKKLAIFVEGETELEFMSRLLKELASEQKINIVEHRLQGGGRSGTPRVAHFVGTHIGTHTTCEAWIYNSTSDSRVNSDIRDHFLTLQSQGFSMILGLKDLRGEILGRPTTHSDLAILERANRFIETICPTSHTKIVTAVMEIEAWFLAETNHFTCIDPRLTENKIKKRARLLGFDPFADDMTALIQPAEGLHNLYSLAGKAYRKAPAHRTRTIACLDFAHLYVAVRHEIPQLEILFYAIDLFLSPDPI